MPGEPVEFIPGPFEAPENAAFRKAATSELECSIARGRVCASCQAYASMAEHAGITLPQALEKPWPEPPLKFSSSSLLDAPCMPCTLVQALLQL